MSSMDYDALDRYKKTVVVGTISVPVKLIDYKESLPYTSYLKKNFNFDKYDIEQLMRACSKHPELSLSDIVNNFKLVRVVLRYFDYNEDEIIYYIKRNKTVFYTSYLKLIIKLSIMFKTNNLEESLKHCSIYGDTYLRTELSYNDLYSIAVSHNFNISFDELVNIKNKKYLFKLKKEDIKKLQSEFFDNIVRNNKKLVRSTK